MSEMVARLGPGVVGGASGITAISIAFLTRVSLVGSAAWLGYTFGTYIYNNNTWLQNGGLDPVFCALAKLGGATTCP
jgi:hypothetical protein